MFLISEKSSALAGDFFVARRIIRRLEVSLFVFFRPDKPKNTCCCDKPALLRARGSGKTLSAIPVQTYAVTVLRARKCGKFPRLLFFMGRGAFGACQKAACHSNSFKDWNIISWASDCVFGTVVFIEIARSDSDAAIQVIPPPSPAPTVKPSSVDAVNGQPRS